MCDNLHIILLKHKPTVRFSKTALAKSFPTKLYIGRLSFEASGCIIIEYSSLSEGIK